MLFWKNRNKSKTFKLKVSITMSNATQADADAIAAQLNTVLPILQEKINAGVDLTSVKSAADAIVALTAPTA